MKKFISNLKVVELCLTYRCPVGCNNCSNLCAQAPAGKAYDLSADDVRRFIDDTLQSEHRWDVITLHGGEPCLNEDALEICELLLEYKSKYNPELTLWLVSSNANDRIKVLNAAIQLMGIYVGVSPKSIKNRDEFGNPIKYTPVNYSPTDACVVHTLGCFQTESCGVCYNYAGYFECSPAAAAARVFGYEPVARSLSELTLEKCDEAMCLHCQHCGFALPNDPRVYAQLTSETWEKGFKAYAESHKLRAPSSILCA